MQRISKNFISRTRRWRQLFFCTFGQLNIWKQSSYLLPCIRISHVIFKYKSYYGKSEHRLRAKIDLPLNAIHGYFNRYRYKTLYFLCTSSRPSCNNSDLRIGKIRKRYYGCFYKTKYSNNSQSSRHKKSKEFMTERKRDNIFYKLIHISNSRIKSKFSRKPMPFFKVFL